MGPKGLEPLLAGLKVRCAAVTPRPPIAGRAYPFQSCSSCHRIAPVLNSGSPESRTQRYAVISRAWATGPRLPSVGMAGVEPACSCAQGTRASRYPSSRFPVRTAGFEPAISWPPARRDTQASPRSAPSSSCGNRTRLSALKGRYPRADRRTSRLGARSVRSWSGGARILVCGFSGRR